MLKLGRAYRNGGRATPDSETSLYWLWSLYSPSPADSIDWTAGQYAPITRGGRIESVPGRGLEKKLVRMISEGSVIAAPNEPIGAAVNVAPDGFEHPVYRSGLALALKLPALEGMEKLGPVEVQTEDDLEPRPCQDQAAVQPDEIAETTEEGAAIEEQPTIEKREDEV